MWRTIHDTRGIAAIEFALALPVLVLMFYGLVELIRFAQFKDQLDSAATQMLDVITQNNEVDDTGLENVFSTFDSLMSPYDVTGSGTVIVSQIMQVSDLQGKNCKPVVTWQYRKAGTSTPSKVGTVRNIADTSTISLEPGDNIIVIEVTAPYKGMFKNGITESFMGTLFGDVYRRSYARPRYGAFRYNPVTKLKASVPCKEPS